MSDDVLRKAAAGLVEAYDGWPVNSYPADSDLPSYAAEWFAGWGRVDVAVDEVRAALASPGAVENESPLRRAVSSCCGARIDVNRDGTSFYRCSTCWEPCAACSEGTA